MLDPNPALRRIVLAALLVCLPAVGMALVGPRLLRWWSHRADPPAAEAGRPPAGDASSAAREAERKLVAAEKSWNGSVAIAPSDAVPDATGEKVRWFQGFGLSVQSRPSGARVVVNGADQGETPIVTSVRCAVGQVVAVEVRKQGLPPRRRVTTCRKDQLVELDVPLR